MCCMNLGRNMNGTHKPGQRCVAALSISTGRSCAAAEPHNSGEHQGEKVTNVTGAGGPRRRALTAGAVCSIFRTKTRSTNQRSGAVITVTHIAVRSRCSSWDAGIWGTSPCTPSGTFLLRIDRPARFTWRAEPQAFRSPALPQVGAGSFFSKRPAWRQPNIAPDPRYWVTATGVC